MSSVLFYPMAHNHAEPRSYSEELSFARQIILDEANALQSLAQSLGADFAKALDLLERCANAHGTVLVTGLGKSGLVGQKIAATLASLGVASHFVHPAEAAHGDLGRFRVADVVVAISNSGETEEVVTLASILRQDAIPIVAITRRPSNTREAEGRDAPGRSESSLQRLATVTLHLPLEHEAGAPDFAAPTSSTTATLALGDAIALALARRREFTDADFAKRHPGGAIGGMLRSVMDVLRFRVTPSAPGEQTFDLPLISETSTVARALEIAGKSGRRPGAILLVDGDGRLAGIFTDGDLRRLILRPEGARELQQPIARVMTRSPRSLPQSSLVKDAILLFRECRQDEIPIVNDHGRPVGLLDVQDLIAMRLVR